jgi:endo-1,4-beta-xylanase
MNMPLPTPRLLRCAMGYRSACCFTLLLGLTASNIMSNSLNRCMGEDFRPKTLIELLDAFRPVVARDSGSADVVDDLIRVSSVANAENPWDVQLGTKPIDIAIRKGDLIEFSFEGRAIESSSPDNLAFATIHFAKCDSRETINDNDATSQVILHPEWRQFHCAARADRDLDVGTFFVAMHCSSQKQKIEIRSPKLLFWGDTPNAKFPSTKIQYQGQDEDAKWRTEAEQRIRDNRMSSVKVQVLDSTGKPMVGVKIRMKQRTHQFAFGTFTDALPIKSGMDAEKYRKAMRQYFNRVTLPRYFADWGTETAEGKIAADNMATWAASEGYQLKTHLLLGPTYLPSRVVDLKDKPDEFQREIERAMDDALLRTAKLPLHSWDALDELRTSTIVADVLGESYYASVFNRGHASQPNARWFINESDILETTINQNVNIDRYEA